MQRFLLPLIAIAVFMSFLKLGSITLFDYDEAVFAEATKEMVQSDNWITPTYNGENRYDKPIFFYWLMAASYKVFGINEFGARFPSAAGSFLLALSIFFFVTRFNGQKNGLYAALSFILSIYFIVYSHAAVTDMTLTLFITLSLFSFFLSLSHKDNKLSHRYVYGFYLFSALAFLTKGLIGIMFPFSIAIVYLLTTEGVAGIKDVFNLKGILLFIIVAAPWYMVQLKINGQEFIQQFFIKHHFQRYTAINSGHEGHVYYFIPVLFIGLFPWIAFLPAGIRYALIKGTSNNLMNRKLAFFAFIWFVFIFVFFSFSTTKLPNYILPSIPAAVILISLGMAGYDNWSRYANLFMAIISVLAAAAFALLPKYLGNYGINGSIEMLVLSITVLLIAIYGFYAFFTNKIFYGIIFGCMTALLLVLSVKIVPLANSRIQGTLYNYSLYAKNNLHERRLIAYDINYPSIVFYSDHRIINIKDTNGLMKLLVRTAENPKAVSEHFLAIAKTKDIGVLKDMGFILLEEDNKYALLKR